MKIIKMTVGIVLTVILLASVLVPIVNTTEPEIERVGWSYDDYVLANGATAASGSLEIVTVDGTDYIHAKDVGTGTITHADSSIETVSVAKAQLDLVYMYGQSNAAYRWAVPANAAPVPKLGTAYYFGLEDRSGPTAAENNTGMDLSECDFWTMLDENGDCRIGDKAPAFSATYNQLTGHKVYWVCGAVGNKGMSQFLPPSGFMWTYGKSVLTDAISLVDTDKFVLNIGYYLWIQGEANATSPVSSYKTQFLTMHRAMLHGDMGVQFKGCFISIVRDENGANAAIAQRELCEEYDTIHLGADIAKDFTVANGLMGPDDLHYSQAGNNLIGKTLGKSVGDYVLGPLADVAWEIYDLLSMIPIIIAAAMIIAIVGMFAIRRSE